MYTTSTTVPWQQIAEYTWQTRSVMGVVGSVTFTLEGYKASVFAHGGEKTVGTFETLERAKHEAYYAVVASVLRF